MEPIPHSEFVIANNCLEEDDDDDDREEDDETNAFTHHFLPVDK